MVARRWLLRLGRRRAGGPLVNRVKDVASEILDWFNKHDDGEFVRLPATHPYSVAVLASEVRCVLYTTKPACVLAALEKENRIPAMRIVGRAGLPNGPDTAWLRELASGSPLVFLGDADPADLLVFAWLRLRMPVSYAGVSDRLVQRLRVQVDDSLTVPLTDTEKAAVSLLAEVCPDYRLTTGGKCAAFLDQGRKIEIEAVLTSATNGATLETAIAQ